MNQRVAQQIQNNFPRPLRLLRHLLLGSMIATSLMACSSYEWGQRKRILPGGFTKATIPVFQNFSMNSGIEAFFTNHLTEEFHRSRVAEIVPKSQAEVMIVGEILGVKYTVESIDKLSGYANPDIVLGRQFRVLARVHYKVIRLDNETVIWEDTLSNEKTFPASAVSIPGLNSTNALYNLSAKRINLEQLSRSMSIEAHARMIENF